MFTKQHLTGAAAAVAAAASLVVAASPAAAYTCSASALRGTVLTQTGIEPVVAGGSGCRTDSASLSTLPAPLAGVASATTALTGPADSPVQQQAAALAGVENLSVGGLRGLPLSLPEAQIPSGLDALAVPLPGGLGLLGLPSQIVVNALPAAQALVPVRQLPDVPLAAIRSLRSAVGAQCLSGLPNLIGVSSVEGLTGLGQGLPTDVPVSRVVTLLDEQTIPLSDLDLSAIQLPGGLSFDNPVTGAALKTAVKQVLAGLPPIVLPAAVGKVETTPDEQIGGDGTLEQHALRMTVTAAGRQVADLVMGIARVATDGLSCAEAAAAPVIKAADTPKAAPAAPVQPASQLAVSCAQSSVTLVNVIDQDDHVTLIGAADKKLIGKRVRIVQTWNGKQVATTKVGRSGFFRTKARMPRESIRYGNRARYVAKVAGETSLPLKLHRRMRFSTLESHGRTVTLKGRIFGPMTDRVIEIRQAISCTKDVVVKRIRPNSDGSWKVTLKAPKHTRAVTYRATTFVHNEGSAKPFPTFTLPGYVSL
ncbi:MAG: hypothetical protein JWM73_665 [Solirubrobacterales bacterium]|nr:hypothetical protein [Solirubrobacterales bacterium]